MPTLEHDGIVSLFRDNPFLALQVLRTIFDVHLSAQVSVRVADSSLGQLIPIEFRADLVLEVLDAQNAVIWAIVLESQREIKARKKYSWPVYATVSRSERECPVILMVVAVDDDVAEWAAQRIDLGAGRGYIEPVVLGPRTIPQITDVNRARDNVELALLSGMAHGNGTNALQILNATLGGIKTLDQERALVYYELLWRVLREPIRAALRRIAMEPEKAAFEFTFLKEFNPQLYQQGKTEGFRDGETKGLRDGETKGELKATRRKVLQLATRMGLVLTDEHQQRLDACEDQQTLDRWFENVLDAKTTDEIFT